MAYDALALYVKRMFDVDNFASSNAQKLTKEDLPMRYTYLHQNHSHAHAHTHWILSAGK